MQEDSRNNEAQEPRDPERTAGSEHRMYGDPGNLASRPSRTSPQEEQTWSVLSHASVLLWLVTGPLSLFLWAPFLVMPAAPLIIWLIYRDRSRRIGFHALQAFWFQTIWTILLLIGNVIAFGLTALTLGLGFFLFYPLLFLVGLVPLAHGVYAAYRVSQGADYDYPIIANLVRET